MASEAAAEAHKAIHPPTPVPPKHLSKQPPPSFLSPPLQPAKTNAEAIVERPKRERVRSVRAPAG